MTDTMQYPEVNRRYEAMEHIVRDRIVGTEFFNFFCGKLLGEGCSRFVFDYAIDSTCVIKIDASNISANILEHLVWNAVFQNKKLAQWFAPIKQISTCGKISIQKKCTRPIKRGCWHKMIPDFRYCEFN